MNSILAMFHLAVDKKYTRIVSMLATIIIVLGATQIITRAYAANYVSATNQIGMVIVNETNGNITFCNGLLKLSGFNMTGRCQKIGSIPTTSLQNNISITLPQSTSLGKYFGSNAYILNTATGVVVICPAFSNGSTGTQVGACLPPSQAP